MKIYFSLFNDWLQFFKASALWTKMTVCLGADGSSRKAIRQGGLWKFLTVRQTYPLSNQR